MAREGESAQLAGWWHISQIKEKEEKSLYLVNNPQLRFRGLLRCSPQAKHHILSTHPAQSSVQKLTTPLEQGPDPLVASNLPYAMAQFLGNFVDETDVRLG